MSDPRFDKLPKWARNEIGKLRADLLDVQKRLNASLGEHDPKFPSYGDYDEHRGKSLPCRQVWFRDYGITVSVREGEVTIMGQGALTILPVVSNSIVVRSDRTYKD